eukprot:172479-Rhodomonas_salina.2
MLSRAMLGAFLSVVSQMVADTALGLTRMVWRSLCAHSPLGRQPEDGPRLPGLRPRRGRGVETA